MDESNKRKLSKLERDIEKKERLEFEFKKAVIWIGTFFSVLLAFQIVTSIIGVGIFRAMIS